MIVDTAHDILYLFKTSLCIFLSITNSTIYLLGLCEIVLFVYCVMPVESSVTKKRALSINTSGVDKSFMQSGRLKKGNRTCYMCGSPDHFIRDCPVASSPNTMLQTGNGSFPHATHGYVSPYWNGPPLPHVRPFANIYGNPGMMPFNPTMVPAPPFAGPMYMPCMFGGPPAYGGFGRMGGATAPIAINTERHLFHSEILDHQGYEKKRKLSNENMSAQSSDDDYHHFKKRCHFSEAERSDDRRSRISRERSVSYSEESFMHRPHKRHLRDTNLDNGKYPVDEKHEKNYPFLNFCIKTRAETLKSTVKEGSSVAVILAVFAIQVTMRKIFERKRLRSDVERHKQKHSSHSDSGLEPSYPGDKKKLKERDFSHVSRHSRLNSRFMDDESSHDRFQTHHNVPEFFLQRLADAVKEQAAHSCYNMPLDVCLASMLAECDAFLFGTEVDGPLVTLTCVSILVVIQVSK
ncbi:hypothetical protein Patl1_13784 [Pistacia atlantica]|uniref:Uncharacterized protein n=1 Tax=Pistacia atlantica TaxID=434234 RepID=A0ACC1AX49_9ROSI|nr:hypothetical protein Patl1_13784 [Pistacia atlantica]